MNKFYYIGDIVVNELLENMKRNEKSNVLFYDKIKKANKYISLLLARYDERFTNYLSFI